MTIRFLKLFRPPIRLYRARHSLIYTLALTPAITVCAAQASTNEEAKSQRVLEEVIVTATKREESLRDIPQSITAITGESMEGRGLMSFSDFVQETPGVIINSKAVGDSRVTIRGIEANAQSQSTPATSGFLVGDVSMSDPYVAPLTPDFGAFDLKSVEVLKGPQGTLFGSTALAGAIRYQVAEANPEAFAVKAFTSYEMVEHGTSRLSWGAAANLPLGDNAAIRFTKLERRYPGWIDDIRVEEPAVVEDANQGDGEQKRLHALWEPGDSWRFTLLHLEEEYASPYANHTSSDEPNGPPVTSDRLVASERDQRYTLDSLEASWTGDWLRIVALVSETDKESLNGVDWTAVQLGESPPEILPEDAAVTIPIATEHGSSSQELRFQSADDGSIKWLLGLYNYEYDFDLELLAETVSNRRPPFNSNPKTALVHTNVTGVVTEQAVFTDLRYRLSEHWEFGIGARFYETVVNAAVRHEGLLIDAIVVGAIAGGGNPVFDPIAGVVTIDADIEEKGINPRFSASWFLNDELSFYASAAKGFRIGGVQNVPAGGEVPETYVSDELWNYELGMRSEWFESTLRLDTTLFYIDWDNPILEQRTTREPRQGYITNVGSVISKGVEMSLVWLPPIDGLSLNLSVGFQDVYLNEPYLTPNDQKIEPGTQMPGGADKQGAATVSWRGNFGPAEISANFTANHVGGGYADITHFLPINDYTTLAAGFSASLPGVTGRPELSLNVSNLRNESHVTGGLLFNAGNPDTDAYYINTRPRTIVARLSVDF